MNSGNGAGLRDLVLVHGWGMNGEIWDRLAERLAGHLQPIPVELPGHGYAPFDPTATRLEDWTRACLAAAPPLALWLGWSLGALVALQAALLAPRRIAGLILVGGTPRFVQGPDWPCALAPAILGQFRADLAQDSAATLQRFLALQTRGSEAGVETLRLLRRRLSTRPAARAEALDTGLSLLAGTDLRDRLGALDCPSLWLLGERDRLVPRALAERLAGLLTEGEVRVLQGAGHAPFLSHPALIAAAIESFARQWSPGCRPL